MVSSNFLRPPEHVCQGTSGFVQPEGLPSLFGAGELSDGAVCPPQLFILLSMVTTASVKLLGFSKESPAAGVFVTCMSPV